MPGLTDTPPSNMSIATEPIATQKSPPRSSTAVTPEVPGGSPATRAAGAQADSGSVQQGPAQGTDPYAIPDGCRQFVIVGRVQGGGVFRPSDWAERLAGVMAQYRPGHSGSQDRYLGYSPYVRPTTHEGVRSIVVDVRLKDIEPLALKFVVSFARDNHLVVAPIA